MRGVWARRAFALLAGALLLAGCGSGQRLSSSDGTPRRRRGATRRPTRRPRADTDTTTGTQGDGLTIKAIDPSKFMRGSSVGLRRGPGTDGLADRAARGQARRLPAALGSQRGRHPPAALRLVPLHVDNPDYSKRAAPADERPAPSDLGRLGLLPAARAVRRTRCTTSSTARVVIHLGLESAARPGTQVVRMWAASPPYMLVVPGLPADVPQRGVTVTSWQRAMICKNLERAHADGDPHLPRRLPRHRPRADPVAQLGRERPGPADARAARPERLMSDERPQ